jgi:hypothetical protein
MSRPEDRQEREQGGYGAAEKDVTGNTPPQEQPERVEYEASNTGGGAMQNETPVTDDSVAVPEAH